MSTKFFSKFDMLFTVNDNIKCLYTEENNNFKLRNDKIYFENYNINKRLDTTKVAMYIGTFRLITSDSDLSFGIDNLNNQINVNGNTLVQTKNINNKNINLYKNYIDITLDKKVGNTKFYVVDKNNNVYEIPFIFNELAKPQICSVFPFQSYANINFGQVVKLPLESELTSKLHCMYSNVYRIRKLNKQQNLYTMMRLYPEKFPIISSVKKINLTLAQQRAYSNRWYRQFGTSQALPVNDNFGGFYCPGSEVPFTS